MLADSDAERTIRDSDLAAPDLLIAEVLNAFWKLRRSGLQAPKSSVVLALLDMVSILPSRPYAERAAEIAEHVDHPIYDCLYLAVAEDRDDVLVTADARLTRKLARSSLRKHVRLLPAL